MVGDLGLTILKHVHFTHVFVYIIREISTRRKYGAAGDRRGEASASVAMVHSIPELIVSSTVRI